MISSTKKFLPARLKQVVHRAINAQHMPLPEAPRALIFLAADYGNIGDIAISCAQRNFICALATGRQVVPVPISCTSSVINSIKRQVTPADLVTIIGGGNMGTMYPDIEELRQLVIRSFPRNRIVCFPQTLDWDDSAASQRALRRIQGVYARHPDLHIFARESVSFAKLNELFSQSTVNVGIAPDIVLSATAESLGADEAPEPAEILLCMRGDREQALDGQQRALLNDALRSTGLPIEATDTHAGGSRLEPAHCARLLTDKLKQFRGARLVVTDRLHGMILSVVAGTPCLVLPNSNHKIRQTWLDWLSRVPQVRFLDLAEIAAVPEAVEALLSGSRRNPSQPPVDLSEYDALRAAVAQP